MKNQLLLFSTLLFLFSACKKEESPDTIRTAGSNQNSTSTSSAGKLVFQEKQVVDYKIWIDQQEINTNGIDIAAFAEIAGFDLFQLLLDNHSYEKLSFDFIDDNGIKIGSADSYEMETKYRFNQDTFFVWEPTYQDYSFIGFGNKGELEIRDGIIYGAEGGYADFFNAPLHLNADLWESYIADSDTLIVYNRSFIYHK